MEPLWRLSFYSATRQRATSVFPLLKRVPLVALFMALSWGVGSLTGVAVDRTKTMAKLQETADLAALAAVASLARDRDAQTAVATADEVFTDRMPNAARNINTEPSSPKIIVETSVSHRSKLELLVNGSGPHVQSVAEFMPPFPGVRQRPTATSRASRDVDDTGSVN
jgi:hypothetical protein